MLSAIASVDTFHIIFSNALGSVFIPASKAYSIARTGKRENPASWPLNSTRRWRGKFNLYVFPIKLRYFHEADPVVRKHTFLLPEKITPGKAPCGQLYTSKIAKNRNQQNWSSNQGFKLISFNIKAALWTRFISKSFIFLVWHAGGQFIPLFWERQWYYTMLDRRPQIFFF